MKFLSSLLLFILFICFFSLYANFYIPIYISEVIFQDGDWYLELFDYYQHEPLNFASLKIESSSGEVVLDFNSLIPFDNVYIISNDDLETPLDVNRLDDHIKIYKFSNNEWWLIDEIYIGDPITSNIELLDDGQSYARTSVWIDSYPSDYLVFPIVKEVSPTPFMSPFTTRTFGTISGYITDSNNLPVENARIYVENTSSMSTRSDINGYYESNELPCRRHQVKVEINNSSFESEYVWIDPDSVCQLDFHTGYIGNSDETSIDITVSILNYPNPFYSSKTRNSNTIFEIKTSQKFKTSEIKIYNLKGQQVNSIASSKDAYQISWNGKNQNGALVASGIYLYRLYIDGKEVGRNKLILINE